MKKNIHPKLFNIKVLCSCSNVFNIYSVLKDNLYIDICNKCHNFYTGKQKIIDDVGRTGKFNKKYKNMF